MIGLFLNCVRVRFGCHNILAFKDMRWEMEYQHRDASMSAWGPADHLPARGEASAGQKHLSLLVLRFVSCLRSSYSDIVRSLPDMGLGASGGIDDRY